MRLLLAPDHGTPLRLHSFWLIVDKEAVLAAIALVLIVVRVDRSYCCCW